MDDHTTAQLEDAAQWLVDTVTAKRNEKRPYHGAIVVRITMFDGKISSVDKDINMKEKVK